MKKTISVLAVFAIFSNVICASELADYMKLMREHGMNCTHEVVNWGQNVKLIEVNSVLNAKPAGYRIKFQYTSIGIMETGIYLSLAESANLFRISPRYTIDISTNEINLYRMWPTLLRLHTIASSNTIYSNVPTNVVVAVTDEGTISLSVEGIEIFTYKESSLPNLSINYIAFHTLGREMEYYYNCTSQSNDSLELSNATNNENSTVEQEELCQEISNSTTECQQLNTNSTTELEQKTDSKDAEINTLTAELVKLRQEISKLTTESQQKPTGTDSEINILIRELDSQRKEISKLYSELDKRDQEISRLEGNSSEQDRIIASYRELYGSLKSLLSSSNVE